MVLRSDEAANQAEIERDQRFRSNVGKGVAAAGTLAGAAVSGGLASRIMPFLSKYVPVDLAIKGISKVNPKVGDFLKKGQEMGLNVEEGMNFIKEKLNPQSKPETAKENRNIVEQYSPELHQFILGEIQQGRSPLEAGALASLDKKGNEGFRKAIKKLEQDHKSPWSAIIETVYGGGQQGGQNQPNQPQQPQGPQGGQPGQGQAALMAILQKLQQSRGMK